MNHAAAAAELIDHIWSVASLIETCSPITKLEKLAYALWYKINNFQGKEPQEQSERVSLSGTATNCRQPWMGQGRLGACAGTRHLPPGTSALQQTDRFITSLGQPLHLIVRPFPFSSRTCTLLHLCSSAPSSGRVQQSMPLLRRVH